MNPLALVHLIVGIIAVTLSLPLINRKIGMNQIYGIRIRKAFESEQLWYDINAYGGRMFLRWGLAIILASLIGMSLPRKLWLTYQWMTVIIILGGLAVVVITINRYAKKSELP